MSTESYSTIRQLQRLRDSVQPRLMFQASTREQWKAWHSELREQLTAILEISGARVPHKPTTVERVEGDAYVREKVVVDVDDGVSMPMYVLTPKRPLRQPCPTLLCLHGHGNGKDDIVGLTHGDPDRINWVYRTNYTYASLFAEHGYLVVAPDARGFGERAEEGGCLKAMLFASLLGRDITGMRVWDQIRALDYIMEHPGADRDAVGCVGLSMGGWHTSILAALDNRVKVAVIGGFFNTFADAFLGNHLHCSCHFPTGLAACADIPDIVALIAPRPLLITSGRMDYFPVAGSDRALPRVAAAYRLLGASDKLERHVFEGGHEFRDDVALAWVRRWLP